MKIPWKRSGLLTALAVFLLLLLFYNPVPDNRQVGLMAAVAVLMAVLWITEAIPMAATALIPTVAFPLLGIQDSGQIAKAYVNSIIFLFIGGFLIALAMERWNLHRRIALNIINRIGRRADLLILGFMAAAAFLSMWISNTATAVMMLPIGLAIVAKMEEEFGEHRSHQLTLALMLGIAYGCSIGGVATLVGTPANLVFVRILKESFPAMPPITFGRWLIIGLPYAFILLLLTWFLLTRILCRFDPSLVLDRDIIRKELRELGPVRIEERMVLCVFIATALLWTFRQDLQLGILTIPGWAGLWPGFSAVDDGTVAMTMALILFILPASRDDRPGRVLEADVFKRLPWGIILLFGGGFALAGGFVSSGLSEHIGASFTVFGSVPIVIQVALICVLTVLLTELTSNTATISMLLPILLSWAVSLNLHPLVFAIPATISCSMAFMMPVATPPNAVVFGSQRIRIIEMLRCGVWINLVGLVLTLAAVYLLFSLVTGSPMSEFPLWAK